MNGEAGTVFTIMVACLALEAIMKDQLKTIGNSKGNGYRLRSQEELESAGLCVKICKYGS